MRAGVITAFLISAVVAAPFPAMADPGKHGGKHRGEYRDDNCDYKIKSHPHGGYKEQVKCHGGPPDRGGPPVVTYVQPSPVVRLPRAIPEPTGGRGLLTCNRDLIGGVLGGAAGGLLGSQIGKGTGNTIATIGGAVIGALVGGTIGGQMDAADFACVGQALEYAPGSRAVAWNNPDQGAAYQVTPMRTFQAQGRQCREYQTVATIAGRTQQVYGTACRQPDGSWQITN
jgi:surface antigen